MIEQLIHFENEAGFKTLFQYATIGIIVINEEGRIVVVNPNAEKLFGYTNAELVGSTVERLIPKEYHRKHRHHTQNYFRNPKPREMGSGQELFALRKDGSKFPVEISLSVYSLESSKMAVAFVKDITTQKVNTEKLEKEVEIRTQQLEKLLLDEQSLSDLKSKFISIASHEFRTPLSTILSSAGLIEKYIERGDIASQLKHTNRIKNAVKNLNTILSDFLSLEKLEEGMVENSPVATDLDEFIQETIYHLEGLKKKEQRVEYQFQDDNAYVLIDQNLMKACITNLLSNAIKYSDEGATIYITLSIADSIIIVVKDQGIGIPLEDQKRLFSRFFRASNVGNIKGTGLGLNIIKKYVEIMGGEISFESQELKGTSFTITIPN
ncbi:MAG: PAS domain-containing sensor histidine kinase [Flammeovirgaceae bacterium]